MTVEELQELVETIRKVGIGRQEVEVKTAKRSLPKRLWETLSAFANAPGGGILILGLDEERGFKAVGVENPAKIQQDLASLCDKMEPPLRPLIEIHNFEGKWIVVAEIPEVSTGQKPCYYKGSGPFHGSFIRVADGDRRLTEYEVQLLWESRRQPRHDRAPVPTRTLQDLDNNRLESFLNRIRGRHPERFRGWDNERILTSLGILTPYEDRICPTLAGYLAFGHYPQDEFPQLHLSIVYYPTPRPGALGPGGERLEENVKVEGNLPEMVLEALGVLERSLRRRLIQRGVFPEEVLEYPREFLRECIVNALLHRDYSPQAHGSPVQIRIFPDRIEIENPGGLFGLVTVDRLGEPGLIAARNATLMRISEDLPVEPNRMMCENRGTGIVTMMEALRAANLSPPQFEDKRTTFLVRASNITLLDNEALRWLNRLSRHVPLTDSQRLALVYCQRYGRISHADYRRLNPEIDAPQITRELSDLVTKGLLVRHGVKRWTFYVLSETVQSLAAARRREDRREPILALLARHGEPMTTKQIAQALGLSLPATRRWLKILRDENRIEMTTTSPKSRFVRYRIVPKRGAEEAP